MIFLKPWFILYFPMVKILLLWMILRYTLSITGCDAEISSSVLVPTLQRMVELSCDVWIEASDNPMGESLKIECIFKMVPDWHKWARSLTHGLIHH